MSLKAARARPRGSKAKATAMRKTRERIQIFESRRNFGGTLCDSKTALLPTLGYGSYMPAGCVFRMTGIRKSIDENRRSRNFAPFVRQSQGW